MDFKLIVVPADRAGRSAPRTRAHRPGVYHARPRGARRATSCGSNARTALPRIVVRALNGGAEHAVAFDEEAYALGVDQARNSTPTRCASSIRRRRPRRDVRLRHGAPRAHASQAPGDPVRPRPRATMSSRRLQAPAADGETRAGHGDPPRRHDAGRLGAAACFTATAPTASRCRRAFRRPAVAGRPRLRLCDRACSRRDREGLGLVSRRQAREQDQHVHGFHRGRRAPRARKGSLRPAASWRMAVRRAAC